MPGPIGKKKKRKPFPWPPPPPPWPPAPTPDPIRGYGWGVVPPGLTYTCPVCGEGLAMMTADFPGVPVWRFCVNDHKRPASEDGTNFHP